MQTLKRKISDALDREQLDALARGHAMIADGAELTLKGQQVIQSVWAQVAGESQQREIDGPATLTPVNAPEPIAKSAPAKRQKSVPPKPVEEPQAATTQEPEALKEQQAKDQIVKKKREGAKHTNSFLIFKNEQRPLVTEEEKRLFAEKLAAASGEDSFKGNVMVKLLSHKWNALTEEQKAPYAQKASEANEETRQAYERVQSSSQEPPAVVASPSTSVAGPVEAVALKVAPDQTPQSSSVAGPVDTVAPQVEQIQTPPSTPKPAAKQAPKKAAASKAGNAVPQVVPEPAAPAPAVAQQATEGEQAVTTTAVKSGMTEQELLALKEAKKAAKKERKRQQKMADAVAAQKQQA